MKRSVYFVSDSTGITAETLGHALLAQFDAVEFSTFTMPFVRTPGKAREVVETVNQAADAGERPIVFSTLADSDTYKVLREARGLVLDLFSVFLDPLEAELQRGSTHAAGRFHGLQDPAKYDVRIDAVEYTLKHDDGANPRTYADAELILVGASRCGKTPTCLYLAMQFGIRAANYPVVEEELERVTLPVALAPHRDRLYGLSIEPERLHRIRVERRPNSPYASLTQCRREVRAVETMLRREKVPFIDTSAISIEEIASRLLQETGLKRRMR